LNCCCNSDCDIRLYIRQLVGLNVKFNTRSKVTEEQFVQNYTQHRLDGMTPVGTVNTHAKY